MLQKIQRTLSCVPIHPKQRIRTQGRPKSHWQKRNQKRPVPAVVLTWPAPVVLPRLFPRRKWRSRWGLNTQVTVLNKWCRSQSTSFSNSTWYLGLFFDTCESQPFTMFVGWRNPVPTLQLQPLQAFVGNLGQDYWGLKQEYFTSTNWTVGHQYK